MFPVCQILYFSCISLSQPQKPFEEGAIFSLFLKMIKLTELCFFFFSIGVESIRFQNQLS